MPAMPGQANDVNVHFHGLTVAPKPPGDDVLTTLAHPGQTLTYRVKIPADHEPGLYWYHPHAHGATYAQVTSGMSGAIVIEGLQQHLPALEAMRERIIVLRDTPLGPNAMNEDMPMTGMAATNGPGGTSTSRPQSPGTAPRRASNAPNPCRAETALQPTLNRQTHARIAIRPGERQLFRVVNASAARYFDLSVDGSTLGLVARDGVPLDAYPGTPPVLELSHVLLPPASRAEFVVTGPAHGGELRSACSEQRGHGRRRPGHRSRNAGRSVCGFGCRRRLIPIENGYAHSRRRPASAQPPVATASTTGRASYDPLQRGRERLVFQRQSLRDGRAAVEIRRSLGNGGRVDAAQRHAPEVHDFHIHQVHFVTESIDGIPVVPRMWSDTLNVPRARAGPAAVRFQGKAVILVDFRDPIVRGTFVYHCHILDHEDQGMMAIIKVI